MEIIVSGTNLKGFDRQYFQLVRCSSALEGLKSQEASIAKLYKQFGGFEFDKAIVFLLKKLFDVRYSKLPFTPQLADEFGQWLLKEYYFLKLPEIELALMDYRGEVYQVIDLEVLKIMIEEFGKRRNQASEQIREATPTLELPSGTTTTMPDRLKNMINEFAIKGKAIKKKAPRPQSLEALFLDQEFTNPEDSARRMREEWSKEWEQINETAKEFNQSHMIEPKELYLMKKETHFIIASTRPITFIDRKY